jgi:tetratricopeptide (TPR) repeat protein
MNSRYAKVFTLILAFVWSCAVWFIPLEINAQIVNASDLVLSPSIDIDVGPSIKVEKINLEFFNKYTYETTKNINQNYYFQDREDKLLEEFKKNGLIYDKPLTYYGKGVEKMRQGDYQSAIKYYSDSLSKGTCAEFYIARGQAYFQKASILLDSDSKKAKTFFDKANEDFSNALKVDPLFVKVDSTGFDRQKYVDPLLARASLYIALHDDQSAINDLNEAIRINPNFYNAYLTRANIYSNQGDYVNAIDDLNTALVYNPVFSAASFLLGTIYVKQKKYQDAIIQFDEVLKLRNQEDAKQYLAQAYYSKGFSEFILEDNQGAINDYTGAIASNINFDAAYLGRGIAEFNLKLYPLAVNDFNRVLPNHSNDPNYEIAYYPLAVSYLKTEQYQEAKDNFKKVSQKNSYKSEFYYNRGLAEFNLKDYKLALDDFNQAILMNYKVSESYFWRGNILSNLDKNEEAILDYSQAIKLNPKYEEAFFGRGQAYYKLSNYQKAIQEYNQAISLNSDDFYYLYRGKAYYHLKEWSKGTDDFNKFTPEFKKDFLELEIFPLVDVKNNSESSQDVLSVDISADSILASGGNDGSISFWKLTNTDLKKIKTIIPAHFRLNSAHPRRIRDLNFSRDGKILVSAGNDYMIKLWNTNTDNFNLIHYLESHSDNVTSVSISHDRKLLASGSDDKTVKLWNVETGNERDTMSGYSNYVEDVVFSPDNQFLATSTYNGKIVIWKVNTNGKFLLMQAHMSTNSEQVRDLAFSPNGKLLASASDDDTIKLWNPQTGDLIRTLKGHSDNVTSVAISPDGKLLASGSDDYTVKLWNLETGDELVTLTGHTIYVQDVAFSPDGHFLASGSSDNTIRVWRMP